MSEKSNNMKRVGLSPAAATMASIFFGASVVATKYVIDQTTPVQLAFLRYLIGSLCLTPFLILPKRVNIPWRDALPIMGLGIVFFGIFPWTFSAALQHISASRGAVVLATMPLLTLGIASAVGYEQITRTLVFGVALTLLGVAIALGTRDQTALPTIWLGYFLMFLTTLCGAIFSVFSKPYLKRHPALHVTALSILAGTLFLAPAAIWQISGSGLPEINESGWMAVVFIGTIGGGIGFYLWIWALERSSPTRVAVFVTLNPLAATALATLLLSETITVSFTIGLSCVLLGIILANRRKPVLTTHSPSNDMENVS